MYCQLVQTEDTKSWFIHHVVASYDVYVRERDRATIGMQQHRRTAIDSASKLFHFRERLPDKLKLSFKQVIRLCPDYKIIADVANSSKHETLTKHDPTFADVSAVEERAVITEFVGGDERFTHCYTYILLRLSDGQKLVLDPKITNVLNFWSSYLKDAGICDYSSRPVPDYSPKAIQRSAAKSLNLEAMKGIDWQPTIELRRFNLSTNRSENCDLSDAKFEWRFYKP